jgi:hypothetical protein
VVHGDALTPSEIMSTPEDPSPSPEIDRLIDDGLDAFARGELTRALALWRRVLELNPDERRARTYIEHVERKSKETASHG